MSEFDKLSYIQMCVKLDHADGVSFWLKKAIRDLDKRDPVDAWIDADMLSRVMKKKMEEAGC